MNSKHWREALLPIVLRMLLHLHQVVVLLMLLIHLHLV